MEEDNKVWLGLGEDLIDLSLFLTNAANNILSYIQSKPWSNKRKLSFLNAYRSIMNSGVIGATNTSGQWEIATLRKVDKESLSRRDEEMLNDAAYFILTLMQTVSPRTIVENDSVKPKTKFEGSLAFENWLSNNYFAGNDIDRINDWNVLDERDPITGKRGVAKRLERMKNRLIEFRDSINDTDWDFSENNAFHNANEVKAKIDKAIVALTGKTEIDLDIIDSLNAIGIKYRDWFDNGLGELSDEIDEETGRHLTWGDALRRREADAQRAALKQAEELKKALEEELKSEETNVGNEEKLNNNQLYSIGYYDLPKAASVVHRPWKRLGISDYTHAFQNSINKGILNISNEEALRIGDFILNFYTDVVKDGPYKGGKYVKGFENLILFKEKLYQTTNDIKELRRVRDNFKIKTSSKDKRENRNIPTLDEKVEFNNNTSITVHSLPGDKKISITLSKLHKPLSGYPNIPTFDFKSISFNANDLNVNDKIRKTIREYIKNNNINLTSDELKQLRKLNWIKQGGKVETLDTIISNFLKNLK